MSSRINLTEIQRELTEIEKSFTEFKQHDRLMKNRIGLEQLKRLNQKYNLKALDESTVYKIIQVLIKCAALFYYHIDVLGNQYNKRKTIKNANDALNVFKNLMTLLYSSYPEQTIFNFIQILIIANYIQYTVLCENLFKAILGVTAPDTQVITILLDAIDTFSLNPGEYTRSSFILRWLNSVIMSPSWPHSDVSILMRILKMFNTRCIEAEANSSYYTFLAGLRICARWCILKASREGLQEVLQYQLVMLRDCEVIGAPLVFLAGPILYASYLFKVTSFSTSICPSVMQNMLLLIASPIYWKALFGNRIFQYLFDTRGNLEQLSVPRIFFLELAGYCINIQNLDAVDEDFIRKYRKELHVSFLTAIINHADEINILMEVFSSMALLITEIPCSFTAIFLVCLVMQVQNTFMQPDIPMNSSHRVHAIVISIMSLVCWIMNAKGLYKYVITILRRRANNAPFLNPPLRASYKYANHFVLWNKPEYFFESCEVRYALWKRFRLPGIAEFERKEQEIIAFV